MPVLGVGEHSTRMSSDMDWFSQMEEHPVDGHWSRETLCKYGMDKWHHINTLQYCSVITGHHPLARVEIHEIHACHSNKSTSSHPYNCYNTTDELRIWISTEGMSVGCLHCDVHARPLRITNGAPFGPSVHCSVKSSLKIIGLGILCDCNEDYMDTKW